MYKVFYNDRIVFFTEGVKNFDINDKRKVHVYTGRAELEKAVRHFESNPEIKELYISHSDIDFVFKEFEGFYTLIEAAGGLVRNEKDEFLAIFRRGKWDLPKGKIETGEKPETAAVREVQEECDVEGLQILTLLYITYHTYILDDTKILKRTYWYNMLYTGSKEPTPQTEEEITEARWLGKNETGIVLKNTFPSIVMILEKAGLLNLK